MKRSEFILQMLALNASLFTNRAALKNNVKDAIEHAGQIFDEASELLKEQKPKKK